MEFDYSDIKQVCIDEIQDIYKENQGNVFRRAALCRAAYSRFKSRCACEFIAQIVTDHNLDISFHSALNISKTLRGHAKGTGKGVSDEYLLDIFATPNRSAANKVPPSHVELGIELAKEHRFKFNDHVNQLVEEIKKINFVHTKS